MSNFIKTFSSFSLCVKHMFAVINVLKNRFLYPCGVYSWACTKVFICDSTNSSFLTQAVEQHSSVIATSYFSQRWNDLLEYFFVNF